MKYRPFRAFCENHFVDSSGDIQNIKADSKEAKKKRFERRQQSLTFQLRTLQRNLDKIYKANREGDAATKQDAFRKAAGIRNRIGELKRNLKALRKGNTHG
jgi:hypothetical protein